METLTTVPVEFWVTMATIVVTLILGQISKKNEWVEKQKLPLQNLLIGIIVCTIEYIITKDFNTAVALSGVMAGGVYDLCKALKKLFSKDEEE